MEIPPKKPHFFKPILPGFKNGLKIPIGFLKYLKGHDHSEHVILRRGGKKWLVKANGRRLGEGSWNEFVEELNLELGDILVFKHEGKMEFEVSIFDREYMQMEEEEEEESEEAATHFECTIRQYCLSRGFIRIPQQFARENRLNNRKCKILLRDKQQRSWTFNVCTSGHNTYFGSAWREFCNTNCLKEGDRLLFQIVSNGKTPIFRIYAKKFIFSSPSLQPEVKRKKSNAKGMSSDKGLKRKNLKTLGATTLKSQIASSTSVDAKSHFISTIKPYTIRNPVLYLPMDFVKSNGLMSRREMILVDGTQRSWSVCLGQMGHHFGIKRGWTQFRNANGVQVGETYKFELIKNGTIPIVHFHCKYSGN